MSHPRFVVGWKTASFSPGDLDPFLGVSIGMRPAVLCEHYNRRPWSRWNRGLVANFGFECAMSSNDPDRRKLRGPIPWFWWIRACRLPGRSLQVASAIWAIAGWNGGRSAVCIFPLDKWSDLALGRKAVRLGL
jgi:hypothetical protein